MDESLAGLQEGSLGAVLLGCMLNSLMISQSSCSRVGHRLADSTILPISFPLTANTNIRGILSTLNVITSGGDGGIRHLEVWLRASFMRPPKTRTCNPVLSVIKAKTGMFWVQSLHQEAEKATTI